jgi:hypothetical protein
VCIWQCEGANALWLPNTAAAGYVEFWLTRLSQILFVINQPDVYKSPSSNTYM